MDAVPVDRNDCPTSEKAEQFRPPEILCQILQFVVGSDGAKALPPSSHVSVNWRRAALSDSSLWTTIYLKQTPPRLLPEEGESEDDSNEDEGDEAGDGEAGTGGTGGCVGWDGWPEKWPKTVEKMRG